MGIVRRSLVHDGISSWFRMFSQGECLQIVDWAIKYGEGSSGLVHARLEASETPLRRCKEYRIDPHEIVFADGSTVSSRVYDGFAFANIWGLGYVEVPSIRVMEYQTGDGYGKHTDWSFGAAAERKISMTVQLSDHYHYQGGRVVLHAGPEEKKINAAQGTATFWPAWTLHEVRPVESGVRYALTAWAHGEKYK